MTDIIIPKATDTVVVDFFNSLIKDFSAENTYFKVGNITLYPENEEDQQTIEQLRKSKLFSITQAHCTLEGEAIYYHQGTRTAQNHHLQPDPHSDTLQTKRSYGENFDFISYNQLIEKTFKIRAAAALQIGEPQKNLLLNHQEVISKLELSLASIAEQFSASRLELEREFSKRRAELDNSNAKYKSELQKEYDKKSDELQAQTDALTERQNALDDRDNTHVRREIRQQFKKDISSYKDKYELTKGTQNLRRSVHFTVWIVLFAILCGIVYFSTIEYPTTSTLVEFMWFIKPIGLTVAALGLATWYLNWNAKWSETHALAEFELRKLEMDMDRASWVVESSLEWKDTEGSNIPDHLLEALSRNLFREGNSYNEHSMNASDQLASALLGQASKASLNIGGNTVEFDRKALKQASKSN